VNARKRADSEQCFMQTSVPQNATKLIILKQILHYCFRICDLRTKIELNIKCVCKMVIFVMRIRVWIHPLCFTWSRLGGGGDVNAEHGCQPNHIVHSLYICRVTVTSICLSDLSRFPFDKQTCGVRYQSYNYNADHVRMQCNEILMMYEYVFLSEMELTNTTCNSFESVRFVKSTSGHGERGKLRLDQPKLSCRNTRSPTGTTFIYISHSHVITIVMLS
jgi:hypothetical protein